MLPDQQVSQILGQLLQYIAQLLPNMGAIINILDCCSQHCLLYYRIVDIVDIVSIADDQPRLLDAVELTDLHSYLMMHSHWLMMMNNHLIYHNHRHSCYTVSCVQTLGLLMDHQSFGHWTNFFRMSKQYPHRSCLKKVLLGLYLTFRSWMECLVYNYMNIRLVRSNQMLHSRQSLKINYILMAVQVQARTYLRINNHSAKIHCILVQLPMMIEHKKIKNMRSSLKFTGRHILWSQPGIQWIQSWIGKIEIYQLLIKWIRRYYLLNIQQLLFQDLSM